MSQRLHSYPAPRPSAGRIFAAWKPSSQLLTINKSGEGLEAAWEAGRVRPALSPPLGNCNLCFLHFPQACLCFHLGRFKMWARFSGFDCLLALLFPQGSEQQHLFHNALQRILQWVEDGPGNLPSKCCNRIGKFFSQRFCPCPLLDYRGMLELRKTTDYGRSFRTIAKKVYSFVLGGHFVFASIMTGTVWSVCVCVLLFFI